MYSYPTVFVTVVSMIIANYVSQNMSSLPMVVASYSLDGTLLALENWSSQQVLLCKDLPSRGAAAVRVGVEYHISVSAGSVSSGWGRKMKSIRSCSGNSYAWLLISVV